MEANKSEGASDPDVLSIQKIQIVPSILDVICRTTGMGFAAVARVTQEKWITCSVLDKIDFGIKPGGELKLQTTICNEVRQSSTAVVIDHADKDTSYASHPTPKMYGFQSYISMPINRRDGSFFGTLCAIDPKPARLNTPEIVGMFSLFSDLISFHLEAVEKLEVSESTLLQERESRAIAVELKNVELQKLNLELESFAHIASHDLQEPLRKIETFSNFILEKDYINLSGNGKHYFDRLIKSVKRMQTLIKDLIMYTQVKIQEQPFEKVPLAKIVEEVTRNFAEELNQKKGTIRVSDMCCAFVIPFQFNQLMQNLIGNAIKFSRPGVDPVISVSSTILKGDRSLSDKMLPGTEYCHITVADNGIGFDQKYSEKIFEVFQRLNGRHEYNGTGIGLSIVKKIVDNHKGLITATSEENQGAQFDIYIPQS